MRFNKVRNEMAEIQVWFDTAPSDILRDAAVVSENHEISGFECIDIVIQHGYLTGKLWQFGHMYHLERKAREAFRQVVPTLASERRMTNEEHATALCLAAAIAESDGQ
jgi:hypothetical protein